MLRSALPLLVPGFALAAVLGITGSAQAAGECELDAECGHGFDCIQTIASARDPGGAEGGMTGSGGTAGTGANGAGAAAGTAMSAGGASSGSPLPPNVCGNTYCDLTETPESCAIDCVYFNYCALAECTSVSDCAEGYECPAAVVQGTGGGPNAPFCGDGLCTGGAETQATCPADCLVTRHCSPESGYCAADADCAAGFYCSFLGSGSGGAPSSGGASSSGGSSGSAGSISTGGAGPSVGGAAAMTPPSDSFAPAGASGTGTAGTAAGGAAGEPAGEADPAPPVPGTGGAGGLTSAGTCMPADGTGGTLGGGTAGGVGVGGGPATGGSSSGGVGTAGSVGIAGTGQGGTETNSSTGSGGTTSVGEGARSADPPSGSSGGSPATEDEDGDSDGRVVTHGGCSVTGSGDASSFGAFALLALAAARFGRRRRAS